MLKITRWHIDGAASTGTELFGVTPGELVARLRRRGRSPVDTPDRGASLWLADLLLVLQHWQADGPPEEGAVNPSATPSDHDHPLR